MREGKTITVRFSKSQELILPESLGKILGLREGDQVEIRRSGKTLHIRRGRLISPPGPLTEIAEIITSSRAVGSIDIEELMNRHGYEQLYGRFSS